MTDYRRSFAAGCGFFFERLQDVQQGDGFRKCSTHPSGLAQNGQRPDHEVDRSRERYSG